VKSCLESEMGKRRVSNDQEVYVVHSWNFYTRPQQISKTNKDRRHTSSSALAVNELLRNSKTAIWWLKIRSLRLKRL